MHFDLNIKKVNKKDETTKLVESKAPYIMYNALEETGIVHNGFSTRYGGVSKGQYESMNFSVKMGDSKENVQKNFEIFTKENGFENPVLSDQTHTVNVMRVTADDVGKGIFREQDFSDIDGMVTNEKNLTLVTSYADCVPLYFVDTKNSAIGLSHAGWRGTVSLMGRVTLEVMEKEFGTKPEDVLVAIGPSICVNCYEVSDDVAKKFINDLDMKEAGYEDTKGKETIEYNTDVVAYKKKDGKYMLNLWAANYKVLRSAGVKHNNIIMPDICTCCNKEILFSHRASHGKRGNLCAFLKLK